MLLQLLKIYIQRQYLYITYQAETLFPMLSKKRLMGHTGPQMRKVFEDKSKIWLIFLFSQQKRIAKMVLMRDHNI